MEGILSMINRDIVASPEFKKMCYAIIGKRKMGFKILRYYQCIDDFVDEYISASWIKNPNSEIAISTFIWQGVFWYLLKRREVPKEYFEQKCLKPNSSIEIDAKDFSEFVLQCPKLSDIEKNVLKLRYLEGKKILEICQLTSSSKGGILNQVDRAIRKIKEHYEEST